MTEKQDKTFNTAINIFISNIRTIMLKVQPNKIFTDASIIQAFTDSETNQIDPDKWQVTSCKLENMIGINEKESDELNNLKKKRDERFTDSERVNELDQIDPTKILFDTVVNAVENDENVRTAIFETIKNKGPESVNAIVTTCDMYGNVMLQGNYGIKCRYHAAGRSEEGFYPFIKSWPIVDEVIDHCERNIIKYEHPIQHSDGKGWKVQAFVGLRWMPVLTVFLHRTLTIGIRRMPIQARY